MATVEENWHTSGDSDIATISCTYPTQIEHVLTAVCLHFSNVSIVGNSRENGRVKSTGTMHRMYSFFFTVTPYGCLPGTVHAKNCRIAQLR